LRQWPARSECHASCRHDDDLVAAQFFSQHVAAAFVCDGGNLIAIFTVVGERTGLKGVPKAEAAQLISAPRRMLPVIRQATAAAATSVAV